MSRTIIKLDANIIMADFYEDGQRLVELSIPNDCNLVYWGYGRKYLKDKGHYFRMFQDVMLEMARDRELNLTDHRVIMVILGKLEFENYFKLSQQEIGVLIDIAQPNVSKSLQKLEHKGFIQCVSIEGRKKIYVFNPYLAFKIKAKNLQDLEEDWDDYVRLPPLEHRTVS